MKEEGRYFGIVPFSLPFWYLKKTAQECFCMFDFGIFGMVAKGIAGLGALFYVAAKVWQSLASAEPIDVYPLLRPFVIGF